MILCIPGFLGTLADFNWLTEPHEVLNLFQNKDIPDNLEDVGSFIVEFCKERKITSILGYSLGGRLALHALCHSPEHFTDAYIISAHTGFRNDAERKARISSDLDWASKFKTLPWEDALAQWNAQDTLKDSDVPRFSHDYNLALLPKGLEQWSLGNQKDLLPVLHTVSTNTRWITGKKDLKFSLVAEIAAAVMPHGSHYSIPGVGHRVMHEDPGSILQILSQVS